MQEMPKSLGSSLRKSTTSSVNGSSIAASCTSLATSRPAATPATPSYAPPSGTVSIWEPIATDSSYAPELPIRLPAASTWVRRPALVIAPVSQRRPSA